MAKQKENCLHFLCEYVRVRGIKDEVMMCKNCKLGLRTRGGKMLMVQLVKPTKK
jgi:hypothetical protein